MLHITTFSFTRRSNSITLLFSKCRQCRCIVWIGIFFYFVPNLSIQPSSSVFIQVLAVGKYAEIIQHDRHRFVFWSILDTLHLFVYYRISTRRIPVLLSYLSLAHSILGFSFFWVWNPESSSVRHSNEVRFLSWIYVIAFLSPNTHNISTSLHVLLVWVFFPV